MVTDLAGLYCYIQINSEEIVRLLMNTTHLSFNVVALYIRFLRQAAFFLRTNFYCLTALSSFLAFI